MITEKLIEEITDEHLNGTPLFLVEVSVRSGNRVFVYIDGDTGVTVDDCKALNRHIESKIDRETEDYDLTVSTAGADSPLRYPRQYPKHTGRTFEISLTDGSQVNGKLVTASPDQIEIEPAPVKGKGRSLAHTENVIIPFDQIKEARIKLAFK